MNWIGLTRGPMGIPGIPPSSILGWEPSGNRGYYYLILAIDLIVLFLIARIINSRVGRASVAIREDELAAQSISINTFHAKVLSFVIATFFAGIAGAFFAHRCPIYQRRFLPAGRDLSHSYHVDCGRNGELPRSGDWRRLLGHSSGDFSVSPGISGSGLWFDYDRYHPLPARRDCGALLGLFHVSGGFISQPEKQPAAEEPAT